MVRGDLERRGFAAEIVRAVRVDPGLALAEVSPMERLYAESLSQQRLGTLILGAFGVFGLALAAIGTYGVTAFRAGRRRAEIGIRLALGARPSGIQRLFVREGLGSRSREGSWESPPWSSREPFSPAGWDPDLRGAAAST